MSDSACGFGLTTFTGFSPAAFAFLAELGERQSRDWFNAHKETYDSELRDPLAALIATLADELARRGVTLQGDPKRSVFRIHRDTRFSNDKRPYKTNVGATLTRDGAKMTPGVLYIHIDPIGCFAAAGFYRPEPEPLAAIRAAIARNPQGWRAALAHLAKYDAPLTADDDTLKRTPRGFETIDAPDLTEALRRRSFIVRRMLSKSLVGSAGLVPALASFAQAALPLLDFGWSALDR